MDRRAIKLLSLLAVLVMASAAFWSAPQRSSASNPDLGDVDCRGGVTSIDALLVLQLAAGIIDSLSCHLNADVNAHDGANAIDAAIILQYVAGLVQQLKIIAPTAPPPPPTVTLGPPPPAPTPTLYPPMTPQP